MERVKQENGHTFKSLKGSALTIALVLISVMSILSLFLLQTYRSVVEFSFRTKGYYQGRIMTDLFLLEYPTLTVKEQQQGVFYYNYGELSYIQEGTQLKIKTSVGKYSWTVYEPIINELDLESAPKTAEINKEQ